MNQGQFYNSLLAMQGSSGLAFGMIDFFHWEMSFRYDLLVLSKLALTWQDTGNTVKYMWLRLILPVEQYQHVIVFVLKQKLGK